MTQSNVTIQDLMEVIELPEMIKEKINRLLTQISLDDLNSSADKLLDQAKASEEAKRLSVQYKQDTISELTFHLYAASLSWEKIYFPLAIPYKIYVGTMRAFTRFLKESQQINHHYKFDRGFWTWRYISGIEFRINELEFEMVAPSHKHKVSQLVDKKYISIHIPSDANLEHSVIAKNYLEAKSFFKQYFPSYHDVPFVTDTWLLSPLLKNWVKPTSNLSLFANDYQLLLTEPTKNDGVFWIFNTISADVANYPEKTSLQRAAKKAMLSGEAIGSALGLFQLEIENN